MQQPMVANIPSFYLDAQILFDMINAHNAKTREKDKEAKRVQAKDEEKKGEGAKENEGAKKAEDKGLALAVIVDDLDRCSKEKIMEMLKATHLLLEQPKAPMAVFLAVDPQLIVSAIAESLEGEPNTVICNMFSTRRSTVILTAPSRFCGVKRGGKYIVGLTDTLSAYGVCCWCNIPQMKALQYLDKIIHLPFCIPPLPAPKKLSLLDALLNGSDNSCPKTLKRVKKFLNVSRSPSPIVVYFWDNNQSLVICAILAFRWRGCPV